MSALWQRFVLWLGARCVTRYGFVVVPATPAALLPSRVEALRRAVETSGHLGHRYHVRRALNRHIEAVADQVTRLAPTSREPAVGVGASRPTGDPDS